MSIFSKIKAYRPNRTLFDLSHERKMTLKIGMLYPTFVQEVVPGDTFKVNSEIFLRMAPMLAPVMHRVNCYLHFFFVPNRLIWNDFKEFITGGDDGLSAPVHPYMILENANKESFAEGELADFLGVPSVDPATTVTSNLTFSALPFRAYQLIYNEFYRDQNLESEVGIQKTSGQDSSTDIGLRRRCWEKDYFTSALPWPQRGSEVDVPFDPVYKDTSDIVRTSDGGTFPNDTNLETLGTALTGDAVAARVENLESSAGVTVNDLRTAVRLQEFLEKMARGGSRYIEQIASMFGVRSSDARLQRPEFLGGGRAPVVYSEVLQSVGSLDEGIEGVLGTMGGHGVSVGRSNSFKKFFEEHGFVMGIMSIVPKPAYQQGVPRMLTRTSKFDYFWPVLANLGEQEIKNKELYYDPEGSDNDDIFAYQSRYAEYKYAPNTVHGEFKSDLNFWHLGRIFNSRPNLNGEFVRIYHDNREFAVQDGTDQVYCQVYNKVKAKRPMPFFGTPRL